MIGKGRGQKVHLQVHAKSCVPHIMARKKKKSGSWFKVDQCTVLVKNIISYQCIFGEEIKKDFCGKTEEKRLGLAFVFEKRLGGKFLKSDER